MPTSERHITLSHYVISYCYLPLAAGSSNGMTIPDAVDEVVCAPDDGCRCSPKHVEQIPDKINYVTLHLVGYILEYPYDARTHER